MTFEFETRPPLTHRGTVHAWQRVPVLAWPSKKRKPSSAGQLDVDGSSLLERVPDATAADEVEADGAGSVAPCGLLTPQEGITHGSNKEACSIYEFTVVRNGSQSFLPALEAQRWQRFGRLDPTDDPMRSSTYAESCKTPRLPEECS